MNHYTVRKLRLNTNRFLHHSLKGGVSRSGTPPLTVETGEIKIDDMECDATGNTVKSKVDEINKESNKMSQLTNGHGYKNGYESPGQRHNTHGTMMDTHDSGLNSYGSPTGMSSKDQHLSSYISSRLRSYADSSQVPSTAAALQTNVSIDNVKHVLCCSSKCLLWKYTHG